MEAEDNFYDPRGSRFMRERKDIKAVAKKDNHKADCKAEDSIKIRPQ